MKRNLMLVIAVAGMLFAGKIGYTRVSASMSSNTVAPATTESVESAALQNLQAQEFTQAELERAQKGLTLSPIEVNAGAGRTRVLIGLGSYLVNAVGGCNDCHTNPPFADGGDPFRGEPLKINTANYLAGGVRFGPFTSRNLTPDPQRGNLPAGMRLDEFIRVMRTGADLSNLHPEISPLLQVMPWTVYGQMTDRDLQAIYLFLSVLPRAQPGQ